MRYLTLSCVNLVNGRLFDDYGQIIGECEYGYTGEDETGNESFGRQAGEYDHRAYSSRERDDTTDGKV